MPSNEPQDPQDDLWRLAKQSAVVIAITCSGLFAFGATFTLVIKFSEWLGVNP